MKKIFILLFAVLLVSLLASCKTEESAESPLSEKSKTNEESTLKSSGSVFTDETDLKDSNTKRVGKEGHGYVSVPVNWVNFTDVDGAGGAIQFSDPTGSLIITLGPAYTTKTSPREIIIELGRSYLNDGAIDIDITDNNIEIDGRAAYQMYRYYKDEDIALVTWAFKTKDGDLHIISAEGPLATLAEVVTIVKDTYSINK